ncbi:MAG: riboflavin synthase [Acidobacteriota bacterium]|nr:MAG: riboflavin synthase [Acidobacteriota bacterium]
MFTGLVEALGTVGERSGTEPTEKDNNELVRLTIESHALAPSLKLGDSVAVSGVCLTATRVDPARFRVDVAPETLRRTTLGQLSEGDAVNLELPLRVDARLGGHFVQGHVDATGRVTHAGPRDGDYVLTIGHADEARPLVVEKGSIAIDGVSLTVTGCGPEWFEVMLIPHTLDVTTLGRLTPGDGINLEYDILAKYMVQLAEPYLGKRSE